MYIARNPQWSNVIVYIIPENVNICIGPVSIVCNINAVETIMMYLCNSVAVPVINACPLAFSPLLAPWISFFKNMR